MKKIFTHLFAAVLLMLSSASWAQTTLENGCVYHFQNGHFTGRAITAVEGNLAAVNATATDQADIKQLWYATQSGDNWIFRNLYNGRYLSQTGSNNWGLTDTDTAASNVFTYIVAGDTKNTIRSTAVSDGNGYMHLGTEGQTNVAGWGSGSGGTQWVVTKKDYSADAITELLATAVSTFPTAAAFQAQLDAIFEDAACTKLNSTYTAMTEEQILADENYKALSTPLRDMVLKVKGGDWAEDNADATKHEGGLDWETKYAKKFRVQMYEPYSIASDITSWLGINAHANNDNPTGIYVPEAGYLYVMVEGTIKDGASLRIVDGGHNLRVTNATSGGYTLKPGLNVINYTGTAGQLYICYNVDTYNPDGATAAEKFPHKLSEYPPLKIHIEGGAITGYYNACGDFRAADSGTEDLWKTITGASVDNDADWEYMETRANLNVIPLLAHRQILLFHLNDYTHDDGGVSKGMAYYLPNLLDVPATPYSYAETWAEYGMGCDASTGKINIMLEAWDRIMYSELATMGLVSEATMKRMNELYPRWESDYKVKYEMYDYENKSSIDNKTYQEFCNGLDYSEYFNHHGIALGTESGYMYGGWDHCGYSITTYNGIVQSMANNAGSTWGPAHEIGHQHQAPLTLNGLTEVTNNLFSNIALWYKGMSTSRYNGSNGSLESVLNAYNTEGSDIYTNNIWALTHLYYRLWLYYHLAGNNTQFYPRLFELLRHEPMQKGYNVSGDVSTLHFYKLACQAAGEDLTEFFRAHGYFSIMDDRLVGDYSNSVYEVSQEMIDEAIAEVKAMRDAEGNPLNENLAIIFICDDDENATYVQHDGKTKREIYGETTSNSDFGSVSDFINGNVSVETAYTATVSTDGVVTMSGGEGGVGFLLLNEDGELVSFSNKSTFELSSEAAYLLATGKASVVAVDTESETKEVQVDMTAMRFALLQELIENANTVIANVDETQTRVGYYKSDAVKNLAAYVEMAEQVIEEGDLANLQAVYELLYAEYNAVVANEFSRVPLVPGSKYAILAKTNDRILSFSDTNVVTVAATENYASTANNQWYVERDGAFHIKNAGNNKYIQNVTDQNGVLYTVGDEVVNMNINEIQLGCYSIATSTVPGRYMNMDGANNARVITWGDTGNNSQWKFILLEENETNAAKEELLELAKKTLALVDVVGTVEYTEGNKIELQSTNSGNANYIWSNAAVQGNDVDKLLDGNKDSFFHSQWNNSTAPADGWGHHLTVDLGENPSLTSFKFKFTTRNQSNLSNYPKTIEVYGSNVGGNDVANYTKLQAASGFATGAGVDNEAVVMGNGTAYRYLRFLVTDASGSNAGTNTGADGKVFFHMSEFSLYPITVTTSVKSDYTSGVTSDAVMNAFVDAEQAKSVYNNASATIDDINAKKTELGDGADVAGSYTTLLTQYNNVLASVVNAKKEQLKELMDNTATLIESVGEVEITNPVPVNLSGKLYAHTPYTAGGVNHADYSSAANNYNLLDGNPTTYFHSDYSANKPAVPYIRVDLGAGNEVKEFSFNYKTRDNGNNCPTEIVIEGSNDEGGDGTYAVIATLTKDANGLPVVYDTFKSQTITSDVPYRYIRFKVTASESTGFFVMSEFGFTKGIQVSVTITGAGGEVTEDLLLDTYLQNAKAQNLYDTSNSVDLLDAMIVDLQAAYDKLYAATNNTADLKNELNELISQAEELHRSIIDLYGNLNPYYSNVIAYEDFLAFLDEMEAASTVANNNEATADEIKAAYNELKKVYDDIQEVKSNDYAGDRGSITDLIAKMEALLGEVADKTTVKTAIALQVDDDEREFYIWSNATAGDCDGIGALIDKNDDASAKTGTFFGTVWRGGAVANYTHYIEVDLGTDIALSELSLDYTTRDSNHSNQRPTSIKISVSNDKDGEHTEIATLSEDMPVGQCAKWEMDGTVALNGYYRYIRFAVATEMGYFNMSDFNLYAHSALVTNSNYQPAITGEQLYAMNVALLDGIAARDKFVTEDNYNAAVTALQAQYDALLAIKNANKTDKDELETLVTETNELVTEVATVNDTETSITMQCTDENASYYLYCNAPGKTNNYDGDDKGVTALLDNDSDTFLHTTYYGNDYADDLDHYLRLDMGENEALAAFKFNYVGRVGNTDNAPKTIVIEGSNDRENFEEITTLKNLPTADNATYQSDVITNGKAYRYIRFMVKETINGSKYKEHQYFALSQFAVTACKTIEVKTEYVSPNLPLSTLVTANNEVVDATVIKNQFYVTETVYDTTVDELQAAYDALNLAKNLKELPVILTTDANNPVLYKIYINRAFNNSAVDLLAYDGESKVDVADLDFESTVQNWYFMQGTDENNYGDVLILPASADGKALATNSFSEGAGKVSAQEPATEGYSYNWEINQIADKEWYNIKMNNGSDTYYYFSNHSGSGNKMGFYNSNTSTDGGSMFRFVLADAYSVLKDCYDPLEKEPEVYAPGYFSNAEQYNSAYDAASEYVNCVNGTEEQYIAAYNELFAQKTALTTRTASHTLEDGAVYRIMNLITKTAGEKYHYIANSSAAITFPTTPAEDNSDLWVCKANNDGTYEFVSALGTLSLAWKSGGETSHAFKIDGGVETGAKSMRNSSEVRMALTNEKHNSGLAFNHASNNNAQDTNWSTDWYFQKVEDVDVKFNVNISSRRFSSLYLPYDVEVPEGVSAFTAVNVDGNNVDLYRVADRYDDTAAGSIIPARTPVILYLEDEPFTAGVYTFTYAPGAEALSDAVAEKVDAAIIFGKILQTPIQCDANTRYYKLGGKSGDTVSKMYWMYKEYGSDGTITNAGTDNGGYIRCSANKIYMTVAESVASNSFSMRFGIDSGTTDINEVDGENGSMETIYDFQGRKLNGITEPGMYIVNGKKVYVK